MSIIIYRFD